MKRQTTQASNENSQDTPMKNIYNSKRKLSVSNTDEKIWMKRLFLHQQMMKAKMRQNQITKMILIHILIQMRRLISSTDYMNIKNEYT